MSYVLIGAGHHSALAYSTKSKFSNGGRNEIHADFFVETGDEGQGRNDNAIQEDGGQPPGGVKLLGRWTRADFSGGFDLLETDDSKALMEFALMWSDVMELKIVPVLEDVDVSEVIGRTGK